MVDVSGVNSARDLVAILFPVLLVTYEVTLLGILAFHSIRGWVDRWETVKWMEDKDYWGIGYVWSAAEGDTFWGLMLGLVGFCIFGAVGILFLTTAFSNLIFYIPWVFPVALVFYASMLGLRKAVDLGKALKKHVGDKNAHK